MSLSPGAPTAIKEAVRTSMVARSSSRSGGTNKRIMAGRRPGEKPMRISRGTTDDLSRRPRVQLKAPGRSPLLFTY
eukprot:17092-Pyramimonas_sp.AAC.2